VRPEHAGLTRDPAVSGIDVIVENAVYVGTDTQYHLAAADSTRLVVRSQNTRADIGAYEAGARLKVLIGDHAVQVLRD